MSQYVKTCTYCKNEIHMSDKEGRWLPYNKDGSTHDCKKKNGKQEITLESVLRKLETRGIIVNREVDEREMTKWEWECVISGRIVPKYSLVSDHVLKHVKEREREK